MVCKRHERGDNIFAELKSSLFVSCRSNATDFISNEDYARWGEPPMKKSAACIQLPVALIIVLLSSGGAFGQSNTSYGAGALANLSGDRSDTAVVV